MKHNALHAIGALTSTFGYYVQHQKQWSFVVYRLTFCSNLLKENICITVHALGQLNIEDIFLMTQ